jgi:hypothetical protein
MSNAGTPAVFDGEAVRSAQLHTVLRFAVGTTLAFVICEARGWYPTFLAPMLAGMLLASLPRALPGKAGIALVLVQAAGAYAAFILTSLLNDTPLVLFGAVGLILFLCFASIAQGRSLLPILLVLIAFAAIPVVTMVAPQQAGALPFAFTRSMAVAVAIVWLVHALWPATKCVSSPPPSATFVSPITMAVIGTAIVLPLMLVYLMYGVTDALPLLIATVVLVVNFNPKRGAMQAMAMMIGNFIGGLTAIAAFALLQIAPSLTVLALITFLVALLFGLRIERGGSGGSVALITFNQAIVIFSLALAPGGSSPGLWAMRLLQFALAASFAVGMMHLFWPRSEAAARQPS